MDKFVIASTRKSAGKTSLIVGISKALNKKVGYIKPLGDRLVYSKKRLSDYDAELMASLFGMEDAPERMNIGFDHSKLRYMYDEKSMKGKLVEIAEEAGKGKDVLFVEGGPSFAYGSSVYLDPISIAKSIGGKFVVVVGGEENTSLDHLSFFKRNVNLNGVDFAGVIMNKVHNVEEFQRVHLPKITAAGIDVLGVIPYSEQMTHLSLAHLADQLFAKVMTGETNLNKEIKTVFIGAMSASAAFSHPLFKKEGKLIITSGDRSDMILASIETRAECVVLTNNIVPPSNIISKAIEHGVTLLLVPYDTYETAKKIELIEPLLAKGDSERVNALEKLVKENIDLKKLFGL
ncbi:MAG: DRTGG domain-containing protein [Candidatus Micrarchaeota archaeon]